MSDISKIKDKIRALLAKAMATEFQGEADSFMAKAQELMEKHQLDLFDLGQEDPIGVTLGVEGQSGPASYKAALQMRLAHYYGAEPIRWHDHHRKYRVHIVGPESARMTTELMTDFIWSQVLKQAGLLVQERGGKKDAATRHIVKALIYRINREMAARKTVDAKPGTSHSLVVVDAVKAFVEHHYVGLKPIGSKAKDISVRALELAKNISINEQIGKEPIARLH